MVLPRTKVSPLMIHSDTQSFSVPFCMYILNGVEHDQTHIWKV